MNEHDKEKLDMLVLTLSLTDEYQLESQDDRYFYYKISKKGKTLGYIGALGNERYTEFVAIKRNSQFTADDEFTTRNVNAFLRWITDNMLNGVAA